MEELESIDDEKIGDGLIRIGALTKAQVDKIMNLQKDGDERLFGEIAISLGYIDDKAITAYFDSKKKK